MMQQPVTAEAPTVEQPIPPKKRTVGRVPREQLMAALGHNFTDKEFEDLCFEFGIELDDITSEAVMQRKEKGDKDAKVDAASEEVVYKIDIPANRYDLLCLEGLSLALNVFRGKMPLPAFTSVRLPTDAIQTIKVSPATGKIRPFVVGCVLRGITFDASRYNRFIELQDKLHENICRKRTLVAIGTHDLDTIQGPFTYEALAPKDIKFAPLNQTREMTGEELMEFYEKDQKLKAYLHIIRNSDVYPVIYDAKRRVLSLPPIINGDHSKISLKTKNVFIECTATDLTRARIVLETVVAMFSVYCAQPFSCEDVLVLNADGSHAYFPNLDRREVTAGVEYVQRILGVPLPAEEQMRLLARMQLEARLDASGKMLHVAVPPTRHDVLQACDVAEDVAIAYGYNKVPRTIPSTVTVGKQQPINKLADLLRGEVAQAGFSEVLTFGLCSHAEAFAKLSRTDDGKTAVVLSNPNTVEFEICRPSLLPGLLKTLSNGQKMPKPIQLFEITDVVLKDPSTDVGARNERHLIAIYGGSTSGFEVVHGLLDHIMTLLAVPRDKETGYALAAADDGAFFTGRCANVTLRGKAIGVMGIVHPAALESFDIHFPTSAIEMSIEPFL